VVDGIRKNKMPQQDIEPQNTEMQNFGEQGIVPRQPSGAPGLFAVIGWLLFGGLFLLAWPMAIIVVTLGIPGNPGPLTSFMYQMLFVGTFCYPIVYISCLVVAIVVQITNRSVTYSRKFYQRASLYACIPVLYICVLIAIGYGFVWAMEGRL